MSQENSMTVQLSPRWLRVLPFLGLGVVIFTLNSATEWNYFLRGYLTLLELQAGIVILYFLRAKIGKSKNRLLK
jgi:hypothetical protein